MARPRHSLAFNPPPALPIELGASTPDPGGPGAIAWSTTLGQMVVWDGAQWVAQSTGTADPDADGADSHFTFTQSVPSDTWIVPHNLNKVPAVTVVDSAGDEVRGDIRHDSKNQLTLRFAYPFSGTAYCN